jgi:hypothetical protein
MTEEKEMLKAFILKERDKNLKITTPWYKRILTKDEFTSKQAKDGKWYVHHCDWKNTIWIGPYTNINECNMIIKSYIEFSLSNKILENAINSKIHSLIITDKDFF